MKGVCWAQGTPSHQEVTAVLGSRIITRTADGVWRSGFYLNNEQASEQATRRTATLEDQGLALTAGPAVFTVERYLKPTSVMTPETMAAICGALGITDPGLNTGTHSAILEFMKQHDDKMKEDFGL